MSPAWKVCFRIPSRRWLLFLAWVIAVGSFQRIEAIDTEQSLDGIWDIVFDHHNEGSELDWHREAVFGELENRKEISVPICWELIEQDYEGVAFYRRIFEVPEVWAGKVVKLEFEAVNYRAEVWLNDEVVGVHEGGFTPFEFRVDGMLKSGETNTLILRVVGPIILSDKNIDGVGPLETPQWRGGITGGIWQSVRLSSSGEICVDDVFIEPDIHDRSATFHLGLDQTGVKGALAEIEIDIVEADIPETVVAQFREKLELHPGENNRRWSIAMPEASLWSPAQPMLYRANIRVLKEGEVSDRWSQRFGLRELTIRDKGFYLNEERIYIKATFFEGLYPNGIAHPDSEAMARREIQLAKDAGFNMIRPWRRPPVPMWLDLADEMGVMVVGSPAIECMRLPLSTPQLPGRVENEIRESVLRDRNRVCVVQWELFNELHRPVLNQMMRPMAMLTRELDPTRLILDESGGWAFGANMYLPNDYEPTKFNDIHNYPGPFIDEERFDGFLSIGKTVEEKRNLGLKGKTPGRNVVPGLMSFVSELGYGSLPDLVDNNEGFRREGNALAPAFRYHVRLANDQRRVLDESGFSGLYPDLQQFCLDQQKIHGAANKRMIEAVRANPDVDGYCIHALSAGDWILGAGLIDLWRQPKSYAYEGTKAANQPRLLSIRVKPRNVYAEKGASFELIGINELDSVEADLELEVVSETGEVVYRQEEKADWGEGVSLLFKERLDTLSLEGRYTVNAKIEDRNGRVVSMNAYSFDVFSKEDLGLPRTRVEVLDLSGSVTAFLKKSGLDVREFDRSSDRSTPVLVSGVHPKIKADERRFKVLAEFMKGGGTAIFVEGAGESFKRGASNQVKTDAFPFEAEVRAASGLWTCIPHLVSDHPIFDGLPVAGMMDDLYENVWATQTLRGLDGETVVASIGYDWFSHDHKMHYSGPGESWWGSDVAVVPFGQGRAIVSQLRIVENLGKDPVADKLLGNLVRWTMMR